MKHTFKLLLTVVLFSFMVFNACQPDDDLIEDFKSVPGRYSPSVAFDWMDITIEMVRTMKLSPIASARVYAYTSLAIYETQIPEIKDAQSMFTYFSGINIPYDKNGKYYGPATANAAIAHLLKKFNPDAANLKTIDSLELVYNNFLKNVTNEKQYESSVNYGKQVADVVFEWAKSDNVLTPCGAWTPPIGPGFWEPTFPQYLPAVLPCLGTNARTFNKDIKTLADPGPPPAFSTESSSAYYKDADEVYQFKTSLTAADSLFINSWLDFQPKNYNTVSRMNRLQLNIMKKAGFNLNEVAVLFSKLNIAMFDAIMTTAAGKFKYTIQRPITYIRNTMGKGTWNSYIPLAPLPPIPTLPFPSYPSYLGAAVGAGADIIETYAGANKPIIDDTQDKLYGSFAFKSMKDFVDKTLEQRIKSGQNFRFSTEAGRVSGKKIADLVNKLPFKEK